MNSIDILKLIDAVNKVIQQSAELRQYANGNSPEEKTLVAALDRLIAQERDHAAALLLLFNSMTKEKASVGMVEYVKETLAANREANKIIKQVKRNVDG